MNVRWEQMVKKWKNQVILIFKKGIRLIQKGMTTLRRRRAYSYYLTLGIFGLLFTGVLISGFSTSQKYNYVAIKEGKSQPMGQANLTVVKRLYDPKQKLYRVDYWVDSENESVDLTNLKIETKAVAKKDLSEFLKTEVVQVDTNYYVTYVKDVPNDFGALKQFIDSGYVTLLKNQTDDLEGIELKVYSNQNSKDETEALTLSTNKEDYVSDKVAYQVKLLTQSIDKFTKEIKDNQEAIHQIKLSNKKIEEGLDTKLEDDLERDQNKIQSNKSEIEAYKEQSEKLQDQIKLLKEKINVLDKKS